MGSSSSDAGHQNHGRNRMLDAGRREGSMGFLIGRRQIHRDLDGSGLCPHG